VPAFLSLGFVVLLAQKEYIRIMPFYGIVWLMGVIWVN
jgi:hypothetical protein